MPPSGWRSRRAFSTSSFDKGACRRSTSARNTCACIPTLSPISRSTGLMGYPVGIVMRLTEHYPVRIVGVMKGHALRRLRGTDTQVHFAARLALHPNTLARYERDELPIPEPIALLARLLARE